MLKDEVGGDLSNFITNGEWHLIGEATPPFEINWLIIVLFAPVCNEL